MKAKGYSIWLMPTGRVYYQLSEIISQLSKKYSTPNFEPHVTLLGNLIGPGEDLISKTLKLVEQLKSFEIKLKKVDYFDEYFKCLFIRAEKSKEVIKANNIAREIFNLNLDPEYMPHLSLMYGNLNPETKEEILADSGKEFDISFEIKSIHLFSTTDAVKDWHRVKELFLKS